MAKEQKTNSVGPWPYIAIVAIVAVVAVVILVMNFSGKESKDSALVDEEEGALAGEAFTILADRCTETDKGFDLYQRGTTSAKNYGGTISKSGRFELTDSCSEDNNTVEYFCNGTTRMDMDMGPCTFGCKNGACYIPKKS